MPELVCPRCQPASTTLTQVISCIALGQANIANPNAPPATISMPAVNTDAMRFPYFGKARSKNLIGAGFVIGFKEEVASGSGRNGKGNRWRLDYDELKGMHVNFESDTIPKMAHRLARVDAQPFVAKACTFPDGMRNLGPEEQVKRLWYSWTKSFVFKGRQIDEIMVGMATAYADQGMTTADAFIAKFDAGGSYADIAHMLKPTAG